MPKFDATEMRAHLNDYLKEIDDLMTSSGSVEQYADFCGTLMLIQSFTENLYMRREDGTFQPLDADHKEALQEQYRDAIEQAGGLLSGEDQGPVAARMRAIARELMPLMLTDQTALEMVDVTKTPVTLPELVSAAREQAVDLGEQESATVGGAMSSRQHMYVESGRLGADGRPTVEEGYFTPTRRIEPRKDLDAVLERMIAKHPKYRPLLEEMRQADYESVLFGSWDHDFYGDEKSQAGESPEALRTRMKSRVNQLVFGDTIQPETLKTAENNEDFFAFFEDLQENMKPVAHIYSEYVAEDRTVDVKEGANIDKRNVAMYRMSCMLGKPNLVAEAKPMTVIQNGVSVTGTFMAAAHGLDVNRLKPSDPEAEYTAQNFESPAAYDDIAAMQALDFICGNTDRHIGNLLVQFEPGKGKDAKMTGLTLIDNDSSFTNGKSPGSFNRIIPPERMGAVGEDFYNAMKLMSKAEMTMMLADCELSQQEIDWAWERKEQLQAKLEADREFYRDKAPGFLDKDHIRIVPRDEWKNYSLESMANVFPHSAFYQIHVEVPKQIQNTIYGYKEAENIRAQLDSLREQARRTILGIPPEVKEEKKETPVPTGKTVGSTLNRQEQNPEREDVVKLSIPPLSMVNSVGAQMSKRYTLSWKEGEDTKEAFFTQPASLSTRAKLEAIFDDLADQNPQYRDALDAIRTTYITNDVMELKTPGIQKMLSENLGLPEERLEALRKDEEFLEMGRRLNNRMSKIGDSLMFYSMTDANLESGRIDMRNVAMSDVGDLLNVPNTLARSRVAQVECDGRIVEGVVMDKADGVLYDEMATGGSPMSDVTEEQINTVYNTPEGLKSIADLQLLDFVCLNVDRHLGNMTYKFENPSTDQMRFIGVQGIDNDMSFGAFVPDKSSPIKSIGALDKMKVISAEMWEKVNDPQTAEKLAEKMRQDGLSDKEIEGARKRLEMVKNAVADKTLSVVGKDEWAKGEFTFEKLSEKGGSMFGSVRQVAKEAVKAKEKWQKLSDAEKAAAKKSLTFTECVKVDQFGKTLTENKRLSELSEKAAEDFRKQFTEELKSAPEPENALSGKELIEKLQKSGKDLYAALDRADPIFHGTSKEYKNLKRSCRELENLAKKIGKTLTEKDALISGKDGELLQQKLTEISNRSAVYQMKKQKEAESGRPLKAVGQARVNAAKQLDASLAELTVTADKSIAKQSAAKSPVEYLNRKMARSQRELSGLEGVPLRRKVAEVLNFRTLAEMDNKELAENGAMLKKATMPSQIHKMTDWMMKQPAFQKLVKDMPDDELRTMAAEQNGRRLFNGFIATKTKDDRTAQMQAERQKTMVQQKKPQDMEVNK